MAGYLEMPPPLLIPNSPIPYSSMGWREGGTLGKGREKDRPTVFGKFSAIYSEAGTVVSSNERG